jgi:uncharacterized protein
MAHEFNHLELRSTQVDRASTFYRDLFGWKLQPEPQMSYTLFTAGEGPGGGMMQLENKDGPSHWVPYVHVADIEASVKQAKKLGATLKQEIMAIPGYGRIAVLADPSGTPIGLSQPAQ